MRQRERPTREGGRVPGGRPDRRFRHASSERSSLQGESASDIRKNANIASEWCTSP